MGALDDLVFNVKKAAKVATNKTEEAVEISKVKLKSISISSKIKENFEKLGHQVYLMNKNNQNADENVKKYLLKLDCLINQQKEKDEKISNIKNQYKK